MGLLLFISILCTFASPAAFTPAVFLSLGLMPVAGVMGAYGHIYFALIMLCLSSVAVSISPISEDLFAGVEYGLITLLPMIIGFGGAALGVYRLRQGGRLT